MSGKTVRIDEEVYTLLLKEKEETGLSITDVANIAIRGYFSDEGQMATDWLKNEVVSALQAERDAYKEEIATLKEHIKALEESLALERQTVARERRLADDLTQFMRATLPQNVTESEQTDTKKLHFVDKMKNLIRWK